MDKLRYYIDTHGNDDSAYEEALALACKLSNQDNQINRVVILIHVKYQTGYFEKILSTETIKKLENGYRFSNCNALFKFETLKTFKDINTHSQVIIACGFDSNEIFPYDDSHSVKVIIAIPWLKDGLKNWVQTWNPNELRGGQSVTIVIPSAIVVTALKELDSIVSGTSHPNDEETTKKYVRALFKYETLDSDIIRGYLVRDLKWHAKDADQIKAWIDKLKAGKSFKGGANTGLHVYYKKWNAASQKSSDTE